MLGAQKNFFYRGLNPLSAALTILREFRPEDQTVNSVYDTYIMENLLKGMNHLDWSFDARKIGACCMTMHHDIRLVLVTPQC